MNCEVDFSERSSRAHRNGQICEEKIMELLPGIEYSSEGADFIFMGAPLEIKGCQETVLSRTQKGPDKIHGRFYLRDYQHLFLIEKKGRYVLMVIDEEENIVHTRMVLAEKLLPEFSGCRTLTWTTVFHSLGVAC